MVKKEENKIRVSDEFINIYRNFNVYNQVGKMKKLKKIDLYLLLTLCLDKHDDNDKIVLNNFQPFKKESFEIFDIQEDKKTDIKELKELIEITNDKYIDTSIIVDKKGFELPEVYTIQEVREEKIKAIQDN